MIQKFEEMLPKKHFVIYIDSGKLYCKLKIIGTLGTMKTVNYLLNSSRYFVISMSKKSYTDLFDYMEKKIPNWATRHLACHNFGATIWKFKGNKSKVVRWITNVSLEELEDVTFFNKVRYNNHNNILENKRR
jgi:hypothetical protein